MPKKPRPDLMVPTATGRARMSGTFDRRSLSGKDEVPTEVKALVARRKKAGTPAPKSKRSAVKGKSDVSAAEVRAKHKEFLFPCVANYYEEPVVLTEGKGSWVHDADGREYLDFFGGILTVGLGHCHDEVVGRVKAQIEQLGHTSTLYPTAPLVSVAEKLARITPGKLKKSFFTTSGTEADETAILVAKLFTGRQEIIALRHGYSGRSLTAMSVTAGITVTVAKRWLLLALSSLRLWRPSKTWLPADLGVHAKLMFVAVPAVKPATVCVPTVT